MMQFNFITVSLRIVYLYCYSLCSCSERVVGLCTCTNNVRVDVLLCVFKNTCTRRTVCRYVSHMKYNQQRVSCVCYLTFFPLCSMIWSSCDWLPSPGRGGCIKQCCCLSVCLSVASRSQRVSLIVIPFCLSVCLDVCRSFRDLQPTMIDRSQPNLVGRYISVLGPV